MTIMLDPIADIRGLRVATRKRPHIHAGAMVSMITTVMPACSGTRRGMARLTRTVDDHVEATRIHGTSGDADGGVTIVACRVRVRTYLMGSRDQLLRC